METSRLTHGCCYCEQTRPLGGANTSWSDGTGQSGGGTVGLPYWLFQTVLGLGVEGCGRVVSDAKMPVEFFGDLKNEDASSVRDDCLWCPV